MENILNKKFGRLTIIEVNNNSIKVKCKCECGNIIYCSKYDLINGHTNSCGCLFKESLIERNTKHGMSNTRLYKLWKNIKSRCCNKNRWNYKYYGGRGISICNEWKNDFINFYNWSMNNGYKENLSIERIDVNGNYEPNNCTWILLSEQQKNRRNVLDK